MRPQVVGQRVFFPLALAFTALLALALLLARPAQPGASAAAPPTPVRKHQSVYWPKVIDATRNAPEPGCVLPDEPTYGIVDPCEPRDRASEILQQIRHAKGRD